AGVGLSVSAGGGPSRNIDRVDRPAGCDPRPSARRHSARVSRPRRGEARMTYRDDEGFSREMDAADPLRVFREQFHIPLAHGGPRVYLTGNSLGLQPKAVRAMVEQELEDWARLGVDAHLSGRNPWLPYHEQFREPMARVVGALPHEVVLMNSLTVNLHLLMVSFYRPTRDRH